MRLKHILKKEAFSGEPVLGAISGFFNKGAAAAKWKLLARPPKSESTSEPLFLKEDGTQLPAIGKPNPEFTRYGLNRGAVDLRRYSQEFRPMAGANLILQLRALFGINVRCEILHPPLTTTGPLSVAMRFAPRYPPRADEFMTTGRNDPCPCGSGKTFKKCCLGKKSQMPAMKTPENVDARFYSPATGYYTQGALAEAMKPNGLVKLRASPGQTLSRS